MTSATRGERVIEHPAAMPGARFFPDARLNFAENLLRGDGARDGARVPGRGRVQAALTLDDTAVGRRAVCVGASRQGVRRGDRVAGYLPNLPEAIIGMLASASMAPSGPRARRTSGSRACSIGSARSRRPC